jgi:hypothetical protein
MENEPQYWHGVKRVKLLSGKPGQVGAKYERVFHAMGRDNTTTLEVLARSDDQFKVASAPGPVQVTGLMTFKGGAKSTTLTLNSEAVRRGWPDFFRAS